MNRRAWFLVAALFALRLDGQTLQSVLIDVQCSGPPRMPRLVLFGGGLVELTHRGGLVERISLTDDRRLMISAMIEGVMENDGTHGWVSYVPREWIELSTKLPGHAYPLPAYVRRSGVPPTEYTGEGGRSIKPAKEDRREALEEIIAEVTAAIGCPQIFDECH